MLHIFASSENILYHILSLTNPRPHFYVVRMTKSEKKNSVSPYKNCKITIDASVNMFFQVQVSKILLQSLRDEFPSMNALFTSDYKRLGSRILPPVQTYFLI